MAISREAAETLGLQVLAWLAGHETLMPVFLGATGVSVDEVRERAGDPAFLASVLDFLLMDDAWVIEACDALSVPYETPRAARAMWPGGREVHWT